MADELQSLLDRIRKDGVDKAEAEARAIVDDARRQAERILAEARQQASELVASAEKEARLFEERARQSIRNAARDVILTLRQTLDRILRRVAAEEVAGAMQTETLQAMLVHMVEHYVQGAGRDGDLTVAVNPQQRQAVSDFLMSRYAARFRAGIDVKADGSVIAGFRVRASADSVEHDFTAPSVADAMARLLQDRLATIVRESVESEKGTDGVPKR